MSERADARSLHHLLAALLAALSLSAVTPAPLAAASPRRALVRVEAGRQWARVGQIVRIRVVVRTDAGVSSAPFTLLYDPAILDYLPTGSREGRFLNRDGASTTFLAMAGASPGGRTGVVVGLSRMGARHGVAGKGVLCELAFRARAPGVSVLSFTRSSLLDDGSAPLPAGFEGTSIRVRGSP